MKFSQGIYKIKNLQKYVGTNTPKFRSSWEYTFMSFCDNNPNVQQWASESIKIPYKDPLTSKQTIYIPDFFIVYLDRNSKKHVELIEIKPANQMIKENVGKNPYNQAQYVKNMAKWQAASKWCNDQGIQFRVLNEHDIFSNTKK